MAVFHLRILNDGDLTLMVEETVKGRKDPYAVNLEQWNDGKGWVYVGPVRDTRPDGVFELPPGKSVEKEIEVLDPYVSPNSPTEKPIPVVGKHRATVRYFISVDEWHSFLEGKIKTERTAVSKTFEVH